MISQAITRQSKPEVGQINLHRPHLVRPDNLVDWWRMAEGGGGSVQDDSGNNHTGTFAGSGSWWGSGQYGPTAEFNNSDDTIAVNGFSLSGESTYTMWVKTSAAAQVKRILNVPAGGNFRNLSINTSGRLLPYDGANIVTGTTNIKTGNWLHVAVVFKTNDLEFYIDGKPDAISAGSTFVLQTSSDETINIGGKTGTTWWDGFMDDVRIYNCALTQNEINEIYLEGDRKIQLTCVVNVAAVGGVAPTGVFYGPLYGSFAGAIGG